MAGCSQPPPQRASGPGFTGPQNHRRVSHRISERTERDLDRRALGPDEHHTHGRYRPGPTATAGEIVRPGDEAGMPAVGARQPVSVIRPPFRSIRNLHCGRFLFGSIQISRRR